MNNFAAAFRCSLHHANTANAAEAKARCDRATANLKELLDVVGRSERTYEEILNFIKG